MQLSMQESQGRSLEAASRLLWILWASYFVFGLVLNVVGAIIPIIIRQNNLSLFAGGMVAFAFYIPFGLFSIPAGLIADHWGAKPVVLSGVLLMTAGCGMIALAKGFAVIMIFSFVIGAGVAFFETAGNPLVARLDRAEHYHRNLTLTIGFCGIGAFAAPLILNAIESHGQPWQRLYGYYALLCAVLLPFLAWAKFPEPKNPNTNALRMRENARLLKSPVAVTYFLAIFFYVGAEVGIASWIVKFLQQVHGLNSAGIGSANDHGVFSSIPAIPILTVSLYWGLQGVGRLTSGAWIGKFGARSVLRVYTFGSLVSLLVAMFAQTMVSAVFFAVCGFFTSVLYALLFSGAINAFSHSKGALSGLLVTASVGGAVIPPLVGIAADHFGLRAAMAIPALCLVYVLTMSVYGKANYE